MINFSVFDSFVWLFLVVVFFLFWFFVLFFGVVFVTFWPDFVVFSVWFFLAHAFWEMSASFSIIVSRGLNR